MNLKTFLAILWGNKWLILLTLAVTMTVVVAGALLSTPVYAAATTLRVISAAGATGSYSDYVYIDRLLNTYTEIARSGPVLEELASRLGLNQIPEVKAETIPNTELIRISVESPNPGVAQAAANTLAEILIARSKELYSGKGKSPQEILGEQLAQAEAELDLAWQEYEHLVQRSPDASVEISSASQAVDLKEQTYATLMEQYEQAYLREAIRANTISSVEPAVLPEQPVRPNRVLNIVLGFLVGLAGGVGLAFLFENLNTRLYTSEQIEDVVRLAPLGRIPRLKGRRSPARQNGDAALEDSFFRLQLRLLGHCSTCKDGEALQSLLVTSSEPGEGKSTIVCQLAQALAQTGQRVIVVDCDLRRPSQHKNFGLGNEIGLSSVLSGRSELDAAVQDSQCAGLRVLTSGPLSPNPVELLGSFRMKALLSSLRQQSDLVLVDAPALLAVSDASVLAPLLDGAVLVARRSFIRKAALLEALRQLEEIQMPVLGVVINEAESNGIYSYYQSRQAALPLLRTFQ
jgi:non-specific protein-tyrosine kinase